MEQRERQNYNPKIDWRVILEEIIMPLSYLRYVAEIEDKIAQRTEKLLGGETV